MTKITEIKKVIAYKHNVLFDPLNYESKIFGVLPKIPISKDDIKNMMKRNKNGNNFG